MKKLVWMLALVGLMFAAAGDANATSDVKQGILGMRYAQMECRANFIYSAMDSADEEGTDLSEDRAAVEAVMAQLRAHVDAGDAGAYNHYMSQLKNAFTTAVRNTKQAQMGALNAAEQAGGQGGQGGQSGEQARSQMRQRMKEDYDAAHAEYVECMHNAVRAMIRAELGEFAGWHENGEQIADNMEGRGYDVSRMRETLSEAEEEADELEAALDGETGTEALQQFRKEKWGREFYLWAQFHKERINLLLDRFVEKVGNYEEQVAEIRALLDEAASLGDDEVYTLEEAREAKALVNQAAQQFSALVEEARGSE